MFQIMSNCLSARKQSVVPGLSDVAIQGPDFCALHLMEDGEMALVDAVPPVDICADGVARGDTLVLESKRLEGGMLMG